MRYAVYDTQKQKRGMRYAVYDMRITVYAVYGYTYIEGTVLQGGVTLTYIRILKALQGGVTLISERSVARWFSGTLADFVVDGHIYHIPGTS